MAQRSGTRPVTVSDVQQLVKRKDEIEAQIKACYELLDSVSAAGPGRAGRGPVRGLTGRLFSRSKRAWG